MPNKNRFSLPDLPFKYSELEPQMSVEQLMLHHQKHHLAYVDGANAIFEKIDKAKKSKIDFDIKALCKELSFYYGGYVLHNLFWENLVSSQEAKVAPTGLSASAIRKNFGSFAKFKEIFFVAAKSVEGSGWAGLVYDPNTERLLISQIEKHNLNVYLGSKILLILDVWEHAYYLDYKNDRGKYIENFWQIVNWDEVERRFKSHK